MLDTNTFGYIYDIGLIDKIKTSVNKEAFNYLLLI